MAFYSKRHYLRVSPPADTQAAIEARLAARKVGEIVLREIAEKYPTITVENAKEAFEFQARRFKELSS